MNYTVKQLADVAGVTRRTLHHYDQIGLLQPSAVGANGYRYYDADAALRLQQILFFRELDLSLEAIRELLDAPDFDVLRALDKHRAALRQRARRLNQLIDTIDHTRMHLRGQIEMSIQDLFAGFDDETQARYEQEAAARYDAEMVRASTRRWNSYSAAERAQIKEEGQAIYRDMLALLDEEPDSPAVQAVVARWHAHLRYFYEPTPEILRGLGQLYNEDPAFAEVFTDMHPELAGFFRAAIEHYCDGLDISR